MLKAIHFGAGNIGRGFIGYLLAKSGYEVTFVDIADSLVDDINKYKEYSVIILSDVKTEEKVKNVKAINLKDKEAVKKAVLDADLVTTSIGANNLKSTAGLLKEVLEERMRANDRPLDIIACENALFATNIIKETILEGASEEFKKYLDEKVGFPNSAVDRIVPNTNAVKECPIDVLVEDFFEWDIEKNKVKVNSEIDGAEYTDNLEPYLERKLFMLNGAHATVAYLGYLKKYEYIHEAIMDEKIRETALSFHKECLKALNIKHGMEISSLEDYSKKVIKRFENSYLQDVVSRVGRDPIRKLSNKDRLVSPLKLCIEYNLEYNTIAKGIAAGLLFDAEDDPKAKEVQALIKAEGLRAAINKVCGIEDEKVIDLIIENYNQIKNN
ncbi:mannitol-1-phosphate 5-dehydrogenase [Clostridium isatidis]|uniref:Mannitol-1-phosphate 5-dehydrogenase n=1 Tax=Clostridium isatidis TaxID=182773 RepID=A0A343JA14_9CLOT|nr:mannitol-1-phosphate 5-dehydrogenase [Clostridium isatidis]ASW42372.1 mannitol-1-phosphate 5-dehydrogenase [Clostridium isatidis]